MTLFYAREDFERHCRHAGISEMGYDAERGEYTNAHTQKTFLVWDQLAQSRHASKRPIAYVLRRQGNDHGISVKQPYATMLPEEWAKQAARGWEPPMALYKAMPITSESEDAILSERQRQIRQKGYHPDLDLRYQDDELLRAGAAYVLQWLAPSQARALWPWPSVPMKTETRLRAIEKGAALLIAEHQRVMTSTVGL